MFDFTSTGKDIKIEHQQHLYKWVKSFSFVQERFYKKKSKLRREKQIEDFLLLNGFRKVCFYTDTAVFNKDLSESIIKVDTPTLADIVIITDQKFSRTPCHDIIDNINMLLSQCGNMILCLNRHYINIDNSYHDETLSDDFMIAITQWLKKSLPGRQIIDLSSHYLDTGNAFTWVIPDRIYYITAS